MCPLRLEKPNAESNFFLTAITNLAESERLGGKDGPWERRVQVPPGRV